MIEKAFASDVVQSKNRSTLTTGTVTIKTGVIYACTGSVYDSDITDHKVYYLHFIYLLLLLLVYII